MTIIILEILFSIAVNLQEILERKEKRMRFCY